MSHTPLFNKHVTTTFLCSACNWWHSVTGLQFLQTCRACQEHLCCECWFINLGFWDTSKLQKWILVFRNYVFIFVNGNQFLRHHLFCLIHTWILKLVFILNHSHVNIARNVYSIELHRDEFIVMSKQIENRTEITG